MTQRIDVEFTADDGVTLGGWLFLPEGQGPHPAITMAHGYAGTREHGIESFARLFAEAGSPSCCTTTGASARATASRGRMSTRGSRSATGAGPSPCWRASPTSIRPGSACGAPATQEATRSCSAQPTAACAASSPRCPRSAGTSRACGAVPPDATAALEQAFNDDERARFRGEPIRYQAIVSKDPTVPASYRATGRGQLLPAGHPAGHLGEQGHGPFHPRGAHVRTRRLDRAGSRPRRCSWWSRTRDAITLSRPRNSPPTNARCSRSGS